MSGNFLSRWSRLKSDSKAPAAPAPVPAETEAAAEPPAAADQPPMPELPPIESLTRESDFSPFLQAGVPEDLRRAALSRLWASDPLFTQPEVFDLHMEDYNTHPIGEVVRTAWQVGKGMVEDLAAEPDPASFTAEPEKTHTKTNEGEDGSPTS